MKSNKEIKKFFLSKYIFIDKNYSSQSKILMVDRGRVDASIINSLITLAVSTKYKKDVIILSDLNKENLVIKIYKHLGFKNYIKGANKAQYIKNFGLLIYSLLISITTILKIIDKGFIWFIENFKIDNIPFGDLIYDTNIRFDHRYLSSKIDLQFIKLLVTSTFRILLIMKYFKKYKISKVITGTENYSFNSGIALRISVFKNIKNFYPGRTNDTEVEMAFDNKKKLFLGRDNIKNYLINKNFEKFKPSKKEIVNFYKSRKNRINKKFFWTLNSFKIANHQSVQGLNFLQRISKIKKKKILYASHAFSDAAHQKGFTYSFKDFYDQFISTLSFVYENDKENIWIFRPHPSSKNWNEEKYFINEIKKYPKKNILICPKNVPIKKLYDMCDVVVTGSGTVGLEFICEGKNTILAGCAAYYDNKITPYYAKSKNQYFEFLKNINYLKKPTEYQKILAKKILYFYESGGFVSKKIDSVLIKKDKISKEFFLNQFGMGFNQKKYFNLVHNMLKQNIYKSIVFKKIIDIV